MTDLKKVFSGFGIFLLAVFATSIGYQMLSATYDVVNSPTDPNNAAIGDTLEGIFWFVLIAAWIVGVFIIPAIMYHEGLTQPSPTEIPKIAKGALGILIFIFGILITTQAWYMTTTITNIMDTPLQKIIFWLGLLFNWTALIIITPYYLIADARS